MVLPQETTTDVKEKGALPNRSYKNYTGVSREYTMAQRSVNPL